MSRTGGDAKELTHEWGKGMVALGACRNVFCKVSGLQEQRRDSRQQWGRALRDTAYY